MSPTASGGPARIAVDVTAPRRRRSSPRRPTRSCSRSPACGVGTASGATATGAVVDAEDGHATFTLLARHPDPTAGIAAGSLVAPMPGSVLRVLVGAR